MTYFQDHLVGSTFSFTYVGELGTEQSRLLIKDQVQSDVLISYVSLSENIWKISFTPTSTGRYDLILQGQIAVTLDVVSATLRNSVQDLLDEALGTWSLDKSVGTLTLFRRNGDLLKTFSIQDNTSEMSRS